MHYMLRAAKSAWPLIKGAVLSGQLFKPKCRLTQPDPDVLCEYNVKIPIADGTILTANVFRSKRAQQQGKRVPVVMCAHPYNNQRLPALGKTPFGGPLPQYRVIPQVGAPEFSTLTGWESPDPNFWVSSGYAIVNLNLPGFGTSGGPPTVFTDHQARSYYEAIEWVGRQTWCTGKVGLSGVSYLAVSQYHVAACQHYGGPPPSLRCISPWEGFADIYREVACPGGLEDEGFAPFWWLIDMKPSLSGSPASFIEHNGSLPMDFMKRHPFYDDFWREKAAKLDQITLPMLVCGSFSDHGLHTVGSFRAFMEAKSNHKWLFTHRTGKWDAYYSPEVQQLTRDFMDCFLKDDASRGFLERAPVRLEVRSSREVVHEVRGEQEWPLARTRYTRLHLNAQTGELAQRQASTSQTIEYPAKGGRTSFTLRFDRNTELTGYMKLRLWVQAKSSPSSSSPAPDDMVIFAAVNKLDDQGRTVHFLGSVGNDRDMVTRGFCRVSRRELDAERSTEFQPILTGTSHHPLAADEIVPVDIALYPSSTFYAAGESLELIVSASEIIPSRPYFKDASLNRGTHVIHCGGEFDSHLLIPIIPPAAALAGAKPDETASDR
jgi:putative CocE/NonD family hydrolase